MGTRNVKDKPKGKDEGLDALAVVLSKLDRKNGVRFLAHTLRAASNAGYLDLEKSVQFAVGESNSIIIYSVEQ